jgi:hypothetical protein
LGSNKSLQKYAKPWIFQGSAAAASFESQYKDKKKVIQKTKHNKIFSILDQ